MRAEYDRYNASETADADTQALLSRILDYLEAGRSPRSARDLAAADRQSPCETTFTLHKPARAKFETSMSRGAFASNMNEQGPPIPQIIGSCPAMQKVYQMIRRVARRKASVLLLGETGTGKELVAKAIHQLSPRAGGPYVRVNCGALSESLLESELFGHVRGAFTGAIDNRTGRFEAAHTGTVFLDEINSTTPKLQVKLLRVLQEREFERVGDTQTIRVDTRVIAASNRDLMDEVESEPLPRGFVLPSERGFDRHPPLARTARGRPGIGRPLPEHLQ